MQNNLYSIIKKLWPINRSLTGKGNFQTLKILKLVNSSLKIKYFKSGDEVYDWVIPKVWDVSEAWISNSKGEKIIDYKNNNLHLISYSQPINKKLTLNKLSKNLFFLKDNKSAIPYLTSYYKKKWGFCLSYNQYKNLKNEKFKVFINSKFKEGKMHYGEIFLKGSSKKEIFFSTYICHPSMANNELSGPALLIYLSKFVQNLKNKKFSYRFIFIPETIGSIAYINKHFKSMKKNILCGFNVSCVGDHRSYSFIPSISGNSFADFIAKETLKKNKINFKHYSWLDRGSDERQYCSPNVDLPFVSLIRSKFGTYKEYHTSQDTLENVVTKKGLKGSFELYKKLVKKIEKQIFFKSLYKCEPMMQKRNLYHNINNINVSKLTQDMMNVLSYCNGKRSNEQITSLCKISNKNSNKIFSILLKNKLIKKI